MLKNMFKIIVIFIIATAGIADTDNNNNEQNCEWYLKKADELAPVINAYTKAYVKNLSNDPSGWSVSSVHAQVLILIQYVGILQDRYTICVNKPKK